MISDSERREVARRLREIDYDSFSSYGEEYEALYRAIGLYDSKEHSEEEWPGRLADLIDPDNIPDKPGETARGLSGRCDRDALLDLSARMGKICDEWGHEACGYFGVASGDCDRCDAYEDPGRCILVAVKDAYDRIRKAVNAYEARPDAPAAVDDGKTDTDASMDDSEAADGARTPSIEVLRWVNGRGGLDAVRESVEQSECRKKLLDCFAMRLGFESLEDSGDIFKELEKRLMPGGMEWPKVDGEPVVIGERMRSCGIDDCKVVGIDPANSRLTLASDNIEEGKATYFTDSAEYCHRPMPKVLDADGVEIREGDVLYSVETGDYVVVDSIEPGNPWFVITDGALQHCAKFTHRAPVLAADGKPLEVGQTVWNVNNGMEFTVSRLPKPGEYQAVEVRYRNGSSTSFDPDRLTHQRPVLDADGVEIRVGDTVYAPQYCDVRCTVMEIDFETYGYLVEVENETGHRFRQTPDVFTHTKPERDNWQRIEEDKGLNPFDYCKKVGHKLWTFDNAEEFKASDLVRRCRALAERGE